MIKTKTNPLLSRMFKASPVIQEHIVSTFRIYGQYDCYKFSVDFFGKKLHFYYDDEDDYLHIEKNDVLKNAIMPEFFKVYEELNTINVLSVVYTDIEFSQLQKATDDIILTMIENGSANYSLGVEILLKALKTVPADIVKQNKPAKFARMLKILESVLKGRKEFIL